MPALSRLQDMLASMPAGSAKVFVFVPYHNFYQARQGSRDAIIWQECKRRVASLASAQNNAHVVDFMIQSPITTTDSNYWDYKHYTVEVAEHLVPLLGKAISEADSDPNYRILYPQP